jgi:hypothetical protein
LENNLELVDFYKGFRAKAKMSSRIDNTQERIKKRLDDLARLDILRVSETPQQKGSGLTNLYEITPYAILLGTLAGGIRASDDKTKKESDRHLYELFNKVFSQYKTSLSKFKLSLYSKLMSDDLFSIFVADVLRKILLSDSAPLTVKELVLGRHMIVSDEKMIDKVDQYANLWFESLKELDADTKNLFLFNTKVEIENEMMIRSSGPQSYEKMRFAARNDYNSIVVEGLCNNCFHVQPRILDMEGYLRLSLVQTERRQYVLSRCKNCNDQGMVIMINLT